MGYIKVLNVPYTVATAGRDRRIREQYPGEPLSEAEYHAAVEASLKPCKCGGRFRYDASGRCPSCRSTAEMWDGDESGPTICSTDRVSVSGPVVSGAMALRAFCFWASCGRAGGRDHTRAVPDAWTRPLGGRRHGRQRGANTPGVGQ